MVSQLKFIRAPKDISLEYNEKQNKDGDRDW